MKVITTEKHTIEVKNEAVVKFDTMVMGAKVFADFMVGQVMGEPAPKFKVVRGEYIGENEAVLQLGGKMVAKIYRGG